MKKVCLIIIDGFGITPQKSIKDATIKAENIKIFSLKNIYFTAKAHGSYVGLPENAMGNSEVGHLTIGSGRVVKQPVLIVDDAWISGLFTKKLDKILYKFTDRIHLIGLVSDGGIHSHVNHLRYLLEYFKKTGKKTFLHAITDGRDTEPKAFKRWYKEFENIVSIAGRYYSMDRDNNINRIEKSFKMMTSKNVSEFDIDKLYSDNLTDEFFYPVLIKQEEIRIEDTLLFFNFRADRMRQIVKRFENYKRFSLTDYGVEGVEVLFNKQHLKNTLPEWLSKKGLKQAHIAETEKYAHVTYFFNGGSETKYKLERRIMVGSPKIATFDMKPETSSYSVACECINAIKNEFDFIVVNFASPDLVGHTGDYESTCKAVEFVDKLVYKIYLECISKDYALVITADHGNSELMEINGEICKTHTTSEVPLIFINCDKVFIKKDHVTLADIAPTILDIMQLPTPEEMEGTTLIEK